MVENLLINKCKLGDGDSFRRLMEIYRQKLFGYLWKYSNSQNLTEELFQETLIKVWKGIKKYDDRKKFSSWLFTIAHNVAIDSLRNRKAQKYFSNIEEVDNKLFSNTPADILEDKETVLIIKKAVNVLSEKQKSVFFLRQHGELTFKDIADITKEPLNTVLSHMRYAIKKIKKQLELENETQKKSVI